MTTIGPQQQGGQPVIHNPANYNMLDDKKTTLTKRQKELEDKKATGQNLTSDEQKESDKIKAELNGIIELVKAPLSGCTKINNVMHTVLNDTAAAKLANDSADCKGKNGEPAISAEKFVAVCKEHFPNVKPGNVSNYITVTDATGSFTEYAVKQEAYNKKQQRQELEAQGEKPQQGV